jgi:hypothetical protein
MLEDIATTGGQILEAAKIITVSEQISIKSYVPSTASKTPVKTLPGQAMSSTPS